METEKKEKNVASQCGDIVGTIAGFFLAAAVIFWGWNVIAPHLNAPIFTYWEIFAMYLGTCAIVRIFKRSK